MAATTLLFADNASTTLAASITAGATTCTLAPGTGALFPNPGANQAFAMSFVDAATGLVTEIVKVTAISGDTVTSMARGQEGTAARAWLAGDLASNFWTAGALGAAAMAQIAPLQQGTYGYAVDSGSANAVVLTLAPAITSYVDGLPINFKAAANNTGATTINVNGVGAVALQGSAGALQGGEIVAGKTYEGNYNSTSNTFVLVGQGGGAEQLAPATQSQHAVQLGQVPTLVGAAFAITNTSLNVTLSNGVSSTLQTLNVTLPNVGSMGKYRLIVTTQAKFNQTVSSPTFQNIQTLINDGTNTASGASWLFAGASSTTAVYGVGDTVLLGPYTPGSTITLTQQGFQNGSAWNAHVTTAQLFVQAVLSSN